MGRSRLRFGTLETGSKFNASAVPNPNCWDGQLTIGTKPNSIAKL